MGYAGSKGANGRPGAEGLIGYAVSESLAVAANGDISAHRRQLFVGRRRPGRPKRLPWHQDEYSQLNCACFFSCKISKKTLHLSVALDFL